METSVKQVEKLETATKEQQEKFKQIVEKELDLVKQLSQNTQIPEEFLPPIYKEDEYGNIMPHILINGEYVVKPMADVILQEKRVVVEYQRLEQLKKEAEAYKSVSKKAINK